MATIERDIPADLAEVILTEALPGGEFGFVDEDPVSTSIRQAATKAGLSRVMYAAGGSQLVGRSPDVGIVDLTPQKVDNVTRRMKLEAQRGNEQILDGLYEKFLEKLREELGLPDQNIVPPAAMAGRRHRKTRRSARKTRRHRRTKRAF